MPLNRHHLTIMLLHLYASLSIFGQGSWCGKSRVFQLVSWPGIEFGLSRLKFLFITNSEARHKSKRLALGDRKQLRMSRRPRSGVIRNFLHKSLCMLESVYRRTANFLFEVRSSVWLIFLGGRYKTSATAQQKTRENISRLCNGNKLWENDQSSLTA